MYKDSFASQVLSDLGLARPAQQQQAGASHSAPISRERYDQIDAGWIIIGSSLPPEQQLTELNKFPEFKRLQAVKNNQYFAVDASMWTGVGGPNAANQAVADVLAHMPKS
jgi:iron complex transport system substrate-binding protein